MRIQITIPPQLAEQLSAIAVLEHRYPRQQAEILLYEAIKETFQKLLRDNSPLKQEAP